MQFHPYLFFRGECEAAFKFYEKVLDGKIEAMMPHAGSPAEQQVPSEWRPKILHARLRVGDQVLMASDAPPGHQQTPQGFSISIQTKDAKEAERIFHALSDGGNITMPMSETFFALRFGMLVDRFGIPWMVNCERPTN